MGNAVIAAETLPGMLDTIQRELERDPRLQSKNTRAGYLNDLQLFETWRAGRALTRLAVEEYAAQLLAAGRAPTGVNRVLAALRWWARRLGDLATEDANLPPDRRREVIEQAARVASLPDVRGGPREKVGRHVPPGELGALMRACADDCSPWGVRDGAVIALGIATGARRFELASLQLADWVQNEDGAAVILHGKGGKLREVEVFNGAAQAVADWLAVRGTEPGPLFCAIGRDGELRLERQLSTQALADVLMKRCQQAGIVKPTRWHDLRRTLAGDLLDAGGDVVTVGKVLGHSNPTTTARYDRRPDAVRRRVLAGRHVPYYGRRGTA